MPRGVPKGQEPKAAKAAAKKEPAAKKAAEPAKMISVSEIASKIGIEAKTARAKLRRKLKENRPWRWPAQEAKKVEDFLSGKTPDLAI